MREFTINVLVALIALVIGGFIGIGVSAEVMRDNIKLGAMIRDGVLYKIERVTP